MINWIKKNPLFIFFFLTFMVTWGLWIPTALAKAGWMSFPIPETLAGLLGAWAPSLMGVFVTAIYFGGGAVKILLSGLMKWRVKYTWYIFAVFLPIVISLLTTGLAVLLGIAGPDFAHPPITQTSALPAEVMQAGFLVLFPTMLISQVFGSSLGEEIGWRGFALSRLQITYSPLFASLILGAIWGVWHFPRLWIPGEAFDGLGFIWLFLGTILSAVLYTWLFNSTNGSLVPVVILHTSQALCNSFLARTDTPMIESLITATIVALIVWQIPALRQLPSNQ